jgi:hypothetical protein
VKYQSVLTKLKHKEMNRKKFLSTIAGATATSVIGSHTLLGNSAPYSELTTKSNQPAPTHKITRGVSLYSYQEALCIKGITLEDCFAELSSIGAYGFEFMLHSLPRESGYPNVTKEYINKWWGWMEKYGTIPIQYCAFHDGYRQLALNTDDEAVEYHTQEFTTAHKMGFKTIRFSEDRKSVVERLIPLCEKLGLIMCREFHATINLKTDVSIQTQLPLAQKYPNVYGFCPDMGIFQKYPRPLTRELQIQEGTLTREIAEYIISSLKKGVPQADVDAQVKKMKPKPGDTAYVATAYRAGAGYNDPKDIIPLLPYCHHIHGKFWEMNKGTDFTDACIPYENVIPVLIQNNFVGCIGSEFEGQREDVGTDVVDEFDEVRRQHVMLKRLLGV